MIAKHVLVKIERLVFVHLTSFTEPSVKWMFLVLIVMGWPICKYTGWIEVLGAVWFTQMF